MCACLFLQAVARTAIFCGFPSLSMCFPIHAFTARVYKPSLRSNPSHHWLFHDSQDFSGQIEMLADLPAMDPLFVIALPKMRVTASSEASSSPAQQPRAKSHNIYRHNHRSHKHTHHHDRHLEVCMLFQCLTTQLVTETTGAALTALALP